MAQYLYRCDDAGHETVIEHPMSDCNKHELPRCDDCLASSGLSSVMRRVLGANLHFTWGRDQFHDGTIREKQDQAISEARAQGIEPEAISSAHYYGPSSKPVPRHERTNKAA